MRQDDRQILPRVTVTWGPDWQDAQGRPQSGSHEVRTETVCALAGAVALLEEQADEDGNAGKQGSRFTGPPMSLSGAAAALVDCCHCLKERLGLTKAKPA